MNTENAKACNVSAVEALPSCAQTKPHKLRELQDADWKFVFKARCKGLSGQKLMREMRLFCFYEYARESRFVRTWAADRKTRDRSSPSLIERQWKSVAPFLAKLSPELIADTPWMKITRKRKDAALDTFARRPSPAMSSLFPKVLSLAYEHQTKSLTFEGWAEGNARKRDCQEVLTLNVDWANATNQELVDALAFWRPEHVPEPKLMDRVSAPGQPGKKGKEKVTDSEAWLRDLGILRLFHSYAAIDARRLAETAFNVYRLDIIRRSRSRAIRNFRDTFGWLGDNCPLSGCKFRDVKNRGSK